MKEIQSRYTVCAGEGDPPTMLGVVCRDGLRVDGLSSDYAEVERLAAAMNRNRLSTAHFWDVIEDFRHSWGEMC